jgi:microcystin-dependent protein
MIFDKMPSVKMDNGTGAIVPSGLIILYSGTNVPAGWFLCNGKALAKDEFKNLFSEIGYSFGGQGETFCVPNFPNVPPATNNGAATNKLVYIIKT